MTDIPNSHEARTRRPSNIRTLPKSLPFKFPAMDLGHLQQAIDMSDMLLLAWTLLERRHSSEDDVHFAWGYGKAKEGSLSRRKVAVGRGNTVQDILREIQILRKQALIPEEVSGDPEGNHMVINNSSGAPTSGSSWTFQIEIHESEETIWLNPSWDASVMGQDTAISNVHCFMDILNSVLLDQTQFVTTFF
ncbi:uncharacterized protein LY89DRAFT_252354 [Mollisia scopiformis]|uniref:Nonribosomal peptide synthetase sidD N-terminal domain-containing protein n=1 Tax=Mollisia scopiformis TaxID=149040 RepID=A0A194WSJ8_MOLSC|nr:uncharacterized protein LY89DRAFT_252354 [Mollisia scopiformis]KUJ10930.1 hypothetical protein LY89DRAFT_252354 [Mollisia scopiformis]